jgi:hypothetical protein
MNVVTNASGSFGRFDFGSEVSFAFDSDVARDFGRKRI